ncbi:hypothetical protein [Sicyoidochytrium minutum DNA virus]|nr:hypothetical protein [Sicyoidochytrium minutum DNA virus]
MILDAWSTIAVLVDVSIPESA